LRSRLSRRFADRHGITTRAFATPSPGIPSIGAKGFIDIAVNAVAEADSALSALQDSSLPTKVGDVELRAALTHVRELLGGVRQRARELERTLGR
jgi:GH25 family lysozyme M1 (1,4-beta-N-acetylmuramidase)